MNDRQEKRIEAALWGLRSARAADGLEERVLAAVRSRAVARESRNGVGLGRWMVWSGVAATALVVVWAVVAGMRYETAARRHELARNEAAREFHVTQRSGSAPGETSRVADGAVKSVAVSGAKTERKRVVLRRAVEQESAAQAPVELQSYPAPEAPLTEQERLLLQVAHSHDPKVLLAMLDPAARAARVTEEKIEVQHFFGVPAKGDQE
jgi:hypothetical protein